MASALFGREGFTPDTLLSLIRSTALEPLVVGPLLYALQKTPKKTILKLPATLIRVLRSPRTTKTLIVLLALGVLRRTNKTLSQLTLNNWQSTGAWDPKHEVAIVTGGSSGIGEQIVLGLARQGIKVLILDVQPPKSSMRSYLSITSHR